MEFFRNPNIDFLGKKWYFLAFSLVFSVAGIFSMLFWHGIPLGIEFRGGTLVEVKFAQAPDDNSIRAAMDRAGLHNFRIQRLGLANSDEVLINLSAQETNEQPALDQGKTTIINALRTMETNVPAGKADLNNTSSLTLAGYLLEKDPLHAGTDANQRYAAQAQAIVDYRENVKSGVLSSMDELKGKADPAVLASLPEGYYLSNFGVRNVSIVGPQVGAQLKNQAWIAIGFSLGGHADLSRFPL